MDIAALFVGMAGPLAYLVLFLVVLVMSASLFLPLPVFGIVIAAAISLQDPLGVGIVAGVASAIGELSGYLIGIGGHKILESKHREGRLYKKSQQLFEKYGFFGIVVAALFPFTPIDFVGIVAGTLRYGWKKFLLATLIGKIPRYILIAYTGAELIHLLFG